MSTKIKSKTTIKATPQPKKRKRSGRVRSRRELQVMWLAQEIYVKLLVSAEPYVLGSGYGDKREEIATDAINGAKSFWSAIDKILVRGLLP